MKATRTLPRVFGFLVPLLLLCPGVPCPASTGDPTVDSSETAAVSGTAAAPEKEAPPEKAPEEQAGPHGTAAEPAPLPLHTIEGMGGMFSVPSAYLVNPGPEGKVSLAWPHYLKPETDWPAADGYDLSIELEDGKTVGMAVLDHPDNPPSGWHNVGRLAMMNPCITAAGPITLTKGEPFVLRYRLVAHDGPAPVDLLKTLSAEWREQ